MEKPEVLGLIMARGGSKGIPKKNITPCAGEPLIAYTINAAKHSTAITRLIVSTDDEEIAAVARAYGAEVPFMRPAEIAADTTLDIPVVEHALAWLKEHEGYFPDIITHLRPTTPLKKSSDIDTGVELLRAHPDAHSSRSVCTPIYTPFKMYKYDEKASPFLEPLLKGDFPETFKEFPEPYNMPRQKLPPIWRHSGYVDTIRRSTIEAGSISGTKIVPLFFDAWRDIDIDNPLDLFRAEQVIAELKKEGKVPWE